MQHFVIIISILLLSSHAFGQKTKKPGSTSSWNDTSFIIVKLNDTISDKKVVAVDVGKKAIIYIKLKPLMLEARENLSNDFRNNDYKEIINYFNSTSAKTDTILISEYLNLRSFEYLVAQQLVNGNANVYYKKQKIFVDTISHRLERYGGHADRFFYLPDRRPFFAVTELMGILVRGEPLLNNGHFDAYIKEGEKLLSLREE